MSWAWLAIAAFWFAVAALCMVTGADYRHQVVMGMLSIICCGVFGGERE